jgi:hypothetical protein
MDQEKDMAGTSGDAFSKDRSLKSEAAAGKGKLAELAENAASAGKAQLDSSLGEAAGQVEQVAKVIDETAARLKKENHEGLAAYASQVAGSIESVANRLRNSSVDELATDARQLARTNPTLFLLGSVAVGFGLTRFLKASSRISDAGNQMRHDVYGSTYGDSRDPTHDWESGRGGRSTGSLSGGGGSTGSLGGGSTSSAGLYGGSSGGMGGSAAGTGGSSSGALGGSSSGGLGGGSSGGSSTGSGGLGGSSTGSSTGSTGSLGGSSTGSLGGSGTSTSGGLGGSSAGGGGSLSSGSTSPAGDVLGDSKRPMFPEMNPAGLTPGGTVGGSRTNEVGGGSHG